MTRRRSGLVVPGVANVGRTASGLILPPLVDASFDPLSIPWVHAYWTEGPEFVALGLANGATVTSWPDEAGTDDLNAKVAAASFPTYAASHASLNNKPAVTFGHPKMIQKVAFATPVAAVNELVLIGKITIQAATNRWAVDGGSLNRGFGVVNNTSPPQMYKLIISPAAQLNSAGNAADNDAHIWRIDRTTNPALLLEDEVQMISRTVATGTWEGLTLGNDRANSGGQDIAITFCGLIDRALTADEKADLQAWAQNTYGTL